MALDNLKLKLFVAHSNLLRQSAVLTSHPNIPAIIELQQNRVGQRRRNAIAACEDNDENPFKKDSYSRRKTYWPGVRQVHHNTNCLVDHQAEEKTQLVTNTATNETVRYT